LVDEEEKSNEHAIGVRMKINKGGIATG